MTPHQAEIAKGPTAEEIAEAEEAAAKARRVSSSSGRLSIKSALKSSVKLGKAQSLVQMLKDPKKKQKPPYAAPSRPTTSGLRR